MIGSHISLFSGAGMGVQVPNRAKRIRALGNGLVPQVAGAALNILTEGAIP